MLRAQVEGERDVHVLAEMAEAPMRTRIPDLVEALTGSFRNITRSYAASTLSASTS